MHEQHNQLTVSHSPQTSSHFQLTKPHIQSTKLYINKRTHPNNQSTGESTNESHNQPTKLRTQCTIWYNQLLIFTKWISWPLTSQFHTINQRTRRLSQRIHTFNEPTRKLIYLLNQRTNQSGIQQINVKTNRRDCEINQLVQLITNFDGTNQLTFDLTISHNQSTNSSIQPTSLGFNQPTLYTSDPVLFHARAHYCLGLCLHPVAKCGHAYWFVTNIVDTLYLLYLFVIVAYEGRSKFVFVFAAENDNF